MKSLILLLFIWQLLHTNIFTQVFAPPGATWIFKINSMDPLYSGYEKWSYESDSIIDGNLCKVLKYHRKTQSFVIPNPEPVIQEYTDYRYFRVDGDTVWIQVDTGSTPVWHLAYNFSVVPGDSLPNPMLLNGAFEISAFSACDLPHYHIASEVIDTGKILIDTLYVRYYTVQYRNTSDTSSLAEFTVYERFIADEDGYFFPLDMWECMIWDHPRQRQCYNDDQISLSDPETECGDLTWFDVFSVGKYSASSFYLNQNPNSGSLIVYSSEEEVSYTIFALDGQIVGSGKVNQVNDISGLKPGLYLLRMQTDNLQTLKLIRN